MMYRISERPGLMKPPGADVCRFLPLKFARRNARRRRPLVVELNLIPLVGLLVVLTLYLLPTFEASGELCCFPRHPQLPAASQARDLEQAPIISIDRDAVTLNADPKADTRELEQDDGETRISGLYDDLLVLKNNYQLLHPGPNDFPGIVIIQADKNLSYGVIRKVATTCTAAGYQHLHFAIEYHPPRW